MKTQTVLLLQGLHCLPCQNYLLTLCMPSHFHAFLLPADFFFKFYSFFSKKSFRNTFSLRVSNILIPDQDRHFVCPDLGPNGLQRLSAGDKVVTGKERVYSHNIVVKFKAAYSVTFDLLILELMFLFFKNTVK